MPAFAGIYELAEARRYLYATAPRRPLRYPTLHQWVRSGLPTNELRSVSRQHLFLIFEDLVSLRMIVALRAEGFSLQHIRKVHLWLQQATRFPRPFALKDLWITDTDIFSEMESRLVSASRQGQYAMDFIKDWLRRLRRPLDGSLDLTFKRVDGKEIASTWTPHSYVVLNPLVQFGAPCIEGTRIPTRAVWSMLLGGDKPEAVARDYEVLLLKVQSAVEWEKRIAGIAA